MPGTAFIYDADDVTQLLVAHGVPEELVRKHLDGFMERGSEIMAIESAKYLTILVAEVTGSTDVSRLTKGIDHG